MGKSRYSCGSQIKEKARQQKQIDKASKRMLARQKKANIITIPPNAVEETTQPISADQIFPNTH